MALRFDITKLDNTKRDHNGYLQASAHATRTGVFVYHHPDGTTTRELRHPDDVFRPDSMASLKNRPVTDGHPIAGKVDSGNTKSLAVGMAVDDPIQTDKFLDTKIQITDESVIEKVLANDSPLRELSCGYDTDIVSENGIFQGEKYDHRQTNILYNHIALVKRGRAGADVRIHLDSVDAVADGLEDMFIEDELITDFAETDKQIEIDVKGFNMFVPKSFRTVNIEGEEGVQVLVGRLNKPHSGKAGSDTPQKYIFEKNRFTVMTAKKFVAERRAKSTLVKTGSTDDDKKDSAGLVNSDKLAQNSDSNHKEDSDMIKIKREAVKIRSFNMDSFQVDIDGTPEGGEKAVEAVLARLDAAITHIHKLESDLDNKQGRIDAMADSGKVTLTKLNDHVKERTDAINAAHYLGLKSTDYMSMETGELKRAIVMKAFPAVKIDELNSDKVEGRYDTIIEGMQLESDNLKSLQELRGSPKKYPLHADESDPRAAFLNDTKDMYKSTEQQKLDS